jgi:predicted amidophosphoribosyltransferase
MIFARKDRLEREKRTIRLMIELYCRKNHPANHAGLCASCQQLADYALQRIERCPFKADKPTCAKCTVHCYKPAMREQVRRVMRYAGPRMLIYHPGLAIAHVVDGARKNSNFKK